MLPELNFVQDVCGVDRYKILRELSIHGHGSYIAKFGAVDKTKELE